MVREKTVGRAIHLSTIVGVIVVTVFVLNTVATAQMDGIHSLHAECNAEYGAGEWVAVPANATERPPMFIGQVAVCVDEDSPRAEDCDRSWIFGCDPPETYGGGDADE